MPNVATPIEVRQIGLALESVRGTAPVAPSSFISLTRDSELAYVSKLIPDPALRGVNARYPSLAGMLSGAGTLKTPARAQNIGEFLKMLFGAPVSTEQTYITISTGVNDALDFVDDVTTVEGVIAAGSYPMGADSSVAGSFCKAIKTAMDAVATGATYTVTFAAGVLTITRSTGTFEFLFATGTHKATSPYAKMGFAAVDTTAAISQTSTVTLYAPFKHAFTQSQIIQLPSYSFYIDRGPFNGGAKDIKVYNLGSMSKLKIASAHDAPVDLEASIFAQQEASYAGAWSPTFSESPVLMFDNVTVKMAGAAPSVPNVASFDCEFNPGMKEYRPLSLQKYAYDMLAAGPFDAMGNMLVFFMDELERAKFLAVTQTSLDFDIKGGAIGVSEQNYALNISLPSVEYEAYPFKESDGFLAASAKWHARYSSSAGYLAYVELINSKSSY